MSAAPDENRMLSAALAYAAGGWPVFPLAPSRKTPALARVHENGDTCRGECGRDGHGFHDATTDPQKIRNWWARSPVDNIGVRTGPEAGFFALDLDTYKPGAVERLFALEEKFGRLPETLEAKTARGGRHLLFRWRPDRPVASGADVLGIGIDTRGSGGYIVAAPSMVDGRAYSWVNERAALAAAPDWLYDEIHAPTSRAAISVVPQAVIPEGARHASLVKIAARLRRSGLDEQALYAALSSINARQCCPPQDDADVLRIAADYARRDGDPLPEQDEEMRGHTIDELIEMTSAETPWVAVPILCRGAVTLVEGPPKRAGKTTLLLSMCQAIMAGEDFLGRPTLRGGVIYLTEQSPFTFRLAIDRARIGPGLPMEVFTRADIRGRKWPEVISALARKAKKTDSVLIVDTVSKCAGLGQDEENDAGVANETMRPLNDAADDGVAVLGARHERKSGGEIGEAGMGSTAWAGSADHVVSLRRMKGDSPSSYRQAEFLGRFDAPDEPVIIDYRAGRYEWLGSTDEVAGSAREERKEAKSQRTKERIVEEIRAGGPLGSKALRDAIGGRAITVDAARNALEADGLLRFDPVTGRWTCPE